MLLSLLAVAPGEPENGVFKVFWGVLLGGASREFFDGVHVRWRLNCSLVHFVGRFCQTHVSYSLAGRSVLGETVPEVLSTVRGRRPRAVLRPGAQFLPIRTDLGGWITFLFFSYWYLKVSERDKVWDRELMMFSNFSNLQKVSNLSELCLFKRTL